MSSEIDQWLSAETTTVSFGTPRLPRASGTRCDAGPMPVKIVGLTRVALPAMTSPSRVTGARELAHLRGVEILRAVLRGVLGEAARDRLALLLGQLRPLAHHPLERRLAIHVELLEVRHDVARHQLEALRGRAAVRPVVPEHQDAAEAAGLLLQALDRRDRVVGRADHGDVQVRVGAHEVVARDALRHDRQLRHVLVVPDPLLQAEAAVADRLLARLGDVHLHDQPPLRAVDVLAVLGGHLLGDRPVLGERVERLAAQRLEGEQADAVAASRGRAAGRDERGHRDLHRGPRPRHHLQARLVELEPFRVGADLLTAQQADQHVERFVHPVALFQDRDAHHQRVGRQRAGPGAEHHAPARDVVEVVDPLGQHQRAVVRQRDHAGAQADRARALGRGGDEHLGTADRFVRGRVVLAHPDLVVAQAIEQPDELQVAVEAERRVVAAGVEGRDEGAEAQTVEHGPASLRGTRASCIVARMAPSRRDWKHGFAETDGLRIHYVEQGAGPAVLLLHGFPESWYSWRHQLGALAQAGYRAIAPDQRGYGQTDAPAAIEAYSQLRLVGDAVALLDALGIERAIAVGHDWGAPVAWNAALLRPDRFRAVIGVSVPYFPPLAGRPTQSLAAASRDVFNYVLFFQEPGAAEAVLGGDVRASLRRLFWALSGELPPAVRPWGKLSRRAQLLDQMPEPPRPLAWLSEADLSFFAEEFARRGFGPGLNWYRNLDRSAEELRAFRGRRVEVPAAFIQGEFDFPGADALALAHMERALPHWRGAEVVPGAGHWVQQERPDAFDAALLRLLRAVGS